MRMRMRNKATAFAVMAFFMLSAAACGKKEEAPVEIAAAAEEIPGMEPSEEASSETVSVEEAVEEETLETVFFDNLTDEPQDGELITETGFCNYEIVAGVDGFQYRIKIDNLEKGMVPWSVGGGRACRMFYASNNWEDGFLMTFHIIDEIISADVSCFNPEVFRNLSNEDFLNPQWLNLDTDKVIDFSTYDLIENEDEQRIYLASDIKAAIMKKDARVYSVLINNKDGSGAFQANVFGVGKYFDDKELLRIIKSVNMRFEDSTDDKFVSYAEKDAGNGKSDYYLDYRNHSDLSKSYGLVVKGFGKNRSVWYGMDGEKCYARLANYDIDSVTLSIYFEMDADIEFLRSLNVKNLSEAFGGDVVEGSFSHNESDDDYSVYYAMIRNNEFTCNRYFYNKKNKTSSMACIVSSDVDANNVEEFFEILRNVDPVP